MKYVCLDPGHITNCSYFPNGFSASNSSSCVVVGGKLDTNIAPSSRPCSVRVARDRVSVSIPDTLFIFVYLRNTMISLPRARRSFSAYAYKVRLTPWTSAKTTSAHLPSGCTNMRVISPRHWKTGRMSALTVFGGRLVSVMVVVEEEEEGSVSVF